MVASRSWRAQVCVCVHSTGEENETVTAIWRSLIESFTLLLLSHYHWTFQHCGAEIMLEFLLQIVIAQLEMIKIRKTLRLKEHSRD